MISADGLDPGGRTGPKRIHVALAEQSGCRFIASPIPDILDEVPHLHLAFGHVHSPPQSVHRLNGLGILSRQGVGAVKGHSLPLIAGSTAVVRLPPTRHGRGSAEACDGPSGTI